MMQLIKDLPYALLIGAALLMALLPFQPEPHLLEKLRMLMQGSLSKAVDIFDLLWHALPSLLLLLKAGLHYKEKK